MIDYLKKPWLGQLLFWSWNILFIILFLYAEVSSGFLSRIVKNAFVGFTSMDFAFFAGALLICPFVCVLIASTVLKNHSPSLLKLFYGFEMPFCLLLFIRIFGFGQLTTATTHLFILFVVGMLSYLSDILIKKENTPTWLRYFQQVGHALLLIIGIYSAILLSFFTIPLLAQFITVLFQIDWLDFSIVDFFQFGFFAVLFGCFFLLTSTVFIAMPIAAFFLYTKAFANKFTSGVLLGKLIMLITLFVNLALLVTFNLSQSQEFAFQELEKDFSVLENQQAFIINSAKIKEGLLNAYLSPYRYFGSKEANTEVSSMYGDAFNFKPATCLHIQKAFNWIAAPFMYNGHSREDVRRAQQYYSEYFDANIQRAEKTAISSALKSTWNRDGIEAGLLNINQEMVFIEKQEVTVTEMKDVAEIEIYESYVNHTFDRQEIFYYFTLPSNAVFTSMWLSDDDKKKKYAFKVSPRGAAQQVYRNEVKRRVDPSLLEQVGPNQYRLRAFPIEAKTREHRGRNFDVIDGKPFHLWLSYKVLMNEKNEWPLPIVQEKRNVFWNKKTQLTINGKSVDKTDDWLPSHIPAKYSGSRKKHSVQISDSISIEIDPEAITHTPMSSERKKMAVLIDGSYSMNGSREALMEAIEKLGNSHIQEYHPRDMEFFFINEAVKKYPLPELLSDLQSNKLIFFKGKSYSEMLELYQKSNKVDELVDAVLILSDAGNYESAKNSSVELKLINSPVYLWHLSEKKASIYTDDFLEIIQNTEGAIVGNLDELSKVIELNLYDQGVLSYKDGAMFKLKKTDPSSLDAKAAADSPISEIATKLFIEKMKVPKEGPERLALLDEAHRLALKEKIVTTFSSMIVLVNDRQKKALEEAEKADDRFQREKETGAEMPGANIDATGVPEPHEWLLLAIVFLLLLYRYYERKRQLTV